MYFLPGTFCLLVPPCVQIHSNYPGLSFLLSSPPHLTAITVVNIMMCVCVCVCVLGILAVLVCPQDHGSPVVWVTWRFGPSQLPQMVRAQQQSARGERGGSAVITSWLSGSAVRRVQQQERVGVAWRLNGGPWSLRGQVLGVCACVCVHAWCVYRCSSCIYICSMRGWVCVAFNARGRGGPHMTYMEPGALTSTFVLFVCAAFWADAEKLILVAVLFQSLITRQLMFKCYSNLQTHMR